MASLSMRAGAAENREATYVMRTAVTPTAAGSHGDPTGNTSNQTSHNRDEGLAQVS